MSASDQQAIREVIRTWMEATAAGDVDRVRSSSSRAITPTSGAACVSPQRPEGGQPMRRSGPVLSVFRKEPDGSWVLARDANMLSVEKPIQS